MIFEKRINLILEILKEEKQISNKYLTKKLNISPSTLRRDLDFLEKKGDIKRVHGGAVLDILSEESSFIANETVNINKKKSIAGKASKFLKNNRYIYLDAGSTTNELIDYMKDEKFIVVTNGLMHIDKLMKYNIDSLFLGGRLKESTKVSYGEIALREINDFNFDIAFIGANGIDGDNYTTADINEAILKKMAIKRSSKSYILADSTKLGKKYFASICKRDEAILITEE